MRRLFSVEFLRLYAKSSVPLLGICVSTQIDNFWSFCGKLLKPEKVTLALMIRRSSVRKKAPRFYSASAYLRKRMLSGVSADMYSYWNEKNTRYANHPIQEFLRPYAKKLRATIRYLQMKHFWSFCGYAQLLEREKVTPAHTIRRSSNTGTVRRHSESG